MFIVLGRRSRARRRRLLERWIKGSTQRGRLREMWGLLMRRRRQVVGVPGGGGLGCGGIILAWWQRRGEESGVNWVRHHVDCLVESAGRCSSGRRVCPDVEI
jgi:hypothetical protein